MTTAVATSPARPARTASDKFETFVLVVILLTVGGFAGAASFTHVHDWTMTNSPTGTGSWFGWANAVVSELVPIAALLVMRRRRRIGQPVGYPASLLVGALVLSVTAQLAVARPTAFGGIVSVVPALAFAALAKLILGKTSVPAESTTVVVGDRPNPTHAPVEIVPDRPATPSSPVQPVPAGAGPSPATSPTVTQDDVITNVPGLATGSQDRPRTVPPLPSSTVETARRVAADHQARTGRPITRDELRTALRVSNSLAGELLAAVRQSQPVDDAPADDLLSLVK
ncbi:hypothetical protein AB0M47_38885 [Hamadaea sp. NPDC051192]|uniref:hypothetical protein n=1 Tax=Hamadaea sp. NPDC051192 TaxID=3154940 RepID=UPI003439CBAB